MHQSAAASGRSGGQHPSPGDRRRADRTGGRTITVGLPPPDARLSLSPLSLVGQGHSVIGSYLGSAVPARDIPAFIALWREGRLPLELLISSTIGLDDINAGMDRLAAGTELRQLIAFDDTGPGM